AEVERVLRVLDGAMLVISPVEGVQPQTPLLHRALERLRVPTLFFLNKLDRRGADPERTRRAVGERLTPAIVPIAVVEHAGDRDVRARRATEADPEHRSLLVERLAERDDALLAAFVDDAGAGVPWTRVRESLARQSRAAAIHPVLMGSAATGVG